MPKLVTKATSSELDKFERKISRQGVARARKGFTLFTSNKDINGIIKVVGSLKKLGLLIDGATETVKHEIKKQERGCPGAMIASTAASLIALMDSSLMQPVASLLINEKGHKGGFLISIAFMSKKDVTRAGREYNNRNKFLVPFHP